MKSTICKLMDFSTILVFYLIFWAGVVFFGELPLSLDNLYLNAPLLALKKLSFPYPDWFQYSFLGALGVAAFVPILNPFRTKSGLYGSAHFAVEKEIKQMGLRDKTGLILAVKGRDYIRTNEPLSCLIYAPPGSGKTAGIIIPSLISCSNSAIVHDPKGELYAKTHRRRSEFSKIIKFSPGEAGSLQWNPLSKEELPSQWEDIENHVDRISSTVIPDNPKNPGDHWPRAARNFFMFWALFLIHRDGETSLPSILEEPLKTSSVQDSIAVIIDEFETTLPKRVLYAGNSLINSPEGEFGSILSTFQTNLSVFFDSRVAANLSGSDFSLKDLRNERTTIYLTVKNSDQTRLKSILGLFFETATLTMLDHEPTKDEYPVTAYLDEFVRMARMQELLEMPAIGRSYKFNAIYVCQSISQIVDIYGQSGADQLKNTCAYHVIFAQNEQKVAEDISKSIGNVTRSKLSESSGSKGSFTKSKSESKEGFALIMPQQIMSMKKGRLLICQQNNFETPVDAKIAFWFLDSAIKDHVQDVDYTEITDNDLIIEQDESPVIIPPVNIEDDPENGQDIEINEPDQEDEDRMEIITKIDNEIEDISLEDEESTTEDEIDDMDMEALMKGVGTENEDIPVPEDQETRGSFL